LVSLPIAHGVLYQEMGVAAKAFNFSSIEERKRIFVLGSGER